MVVFREAKLNGVVHSTDEFFVKNGKYVYDNSRLQEAHEWNHRKGLTLLLTNHTFMCDETLLSPFTFSPVFSARVGRTTEESDHYRQHAHASLGDAILHRPSKEPFNFKKKSSWV